MPASGSITHWIRAVRQGDSAAAEGLWKRYFPRLVQLARKKLQGSAGKMADEEDVALSAMNRFYQAAQDGRYPNLADRDGLWRLLLEITRNRVIDLQRRENRQRRGGGTALDEAPIAEAPDETPNPELAAMMASECQRLLEQLHDGELQAIAMAKMDGADNAEIAAQLNCSQRTVERRLKLIRDKWKHFWEQEKERNE
jgi:RNA polymerase sigma factor (sigma-70 family)